MYFGNCDLCKGKKSKKDPHSLCPDCKPACSVDIQCNECESLTEKDFAVYLAVLRKRSLQRTARAKTMSGVEVDIHAEDDDLLGQDVERSSLSSTSHQSQVVCTAQAPAVVTTSPAVTSVALTTVVAPGQIVNTPPIMSTHQTPASQAPAPWQAPGLWPQSLGMWSNQQQWAPHQSSPSQPRPPPPSPQPYQQWPAAPYGFPPPYGYPYFPPAPQAPQVFATPVPVTSATVVSSASVSDSTTSSGTRERSRSPVRLPKDTGD